MIKAADIHHAAKLLETIMLHQAIQHHFERNAVERIIWALRHFY